MKSKKILDSNYFLLIMFFILLSFLIINIVLFINGKSIDSYWINNGISFDSKYKYLGFISIITGWLSEFLGVFGTILLGKKSKYFLPLILISIIFGITNQIISGVFFTALTYIFTLFLVSITYFKWNNNEDKEIKTISIVIQITIFISWIVFGFLFYSIILPSSSIVLYNSLDVVSSAISILSWWMILNKKKIGFVGFIIGDLLYVIMFSVIGLYVVAMGFALYVVISILSINSY